MTQSFPTAPCLCTNCGYHLDMAMPVGHDSAPKNGDLTACVNCCQPFQMTEDKWMPLSPHDVATLPAETAVKVLALMYLIAKYGPDHDITKRDGGHA